MPSSSPIDPALKRRTWRPYPPEAIEIVRQNKHPVAICEELAALTGKNKDACWRFMTRHGIQRPGSATRHKFDPDKFDKLIEYISDHGVHAAAQRFHCNTKSLYNFLYRQEHTKMGKHTMSLRQVSDHLGVKYSRVREWIERGLLKARRFEHESRKGNILYLIELDALQKFCTDHPELLITRRSSPTRVHFLQEFILAPKHADLIRSREAKREAEAFERGEYLENPRRSQRSA